MREPLSPIEHSLLCNFCTSRFGNKQAVIDQLEIARNTLVKRLKNPAFLWRPQDKRLILDLVSPADAPSLRAGVIDKLRTEIKGRTMCAEVVDRALDTIQHSAEASGLLNAAASERFVRIARSGMGRMRTEEKRAAVADEAKALCRSLGNGRLRVALPCIELMPCATLAAMQRQLDRVACLDCDFGYPNGSELARKLHSAPDDLPDVLITGVSAFTLNKGVRVNGTAALSNYQFLFPIHAIVQQCFGIVDTIGEATRILFVPGGCTQHYVQEKAKKFKVGLKEEHIENDPFLHADPRIEPTDVIVAYPPIGNRLWRDYQLLPVYGPEQSNFPGLLRKRRLVGA